MSLVPLRGLVSRTVSSASYVVDDGGYQHVYLVFDDGTELRVSEISQTGEISVKVDGAIVERPDHG